MKMIICPVILYAIFSPIISSAATRCQGLAHDHSFVVSQDGPDVEVSLDNTKLVKYDSLKNSKEGTLKISGKTLTYVRVANITVDDFLNKKALRYRLTLGMIAGRDEYEGDEDIWGNYADELISSLKCQ